MQVSVTEVIAFLESSKRDILAQKVDGHEEVAYWLEQITDHVATLKPGQHLDYNSRHIGL
jgi:bacterioferritin (cytochrome b1)